MSATENTWTIKHTSKYGHYAVIWADDLRGDQGWAIVELIACRIVLDRDGYPAPIEWMDSEREAIRYADEWDASTHYESLLEMIESMLEKADPNTRSGRAKIDTIARALGL